MYCFSSEAVGFFAGDVEVSVHCVGVGVCEQTCARVTERGRETWREMESELCADESRRIESSQFVLFFSLSLSIFLCFFPHLFLSSSPTPSLAGTVRMWECVLH